MQKALGPSPVQVGRAPGRSQSAHTGGTPRCGRVPRRQEADSRCGRSAWHEGSTAVLCSNITPMGCAGKSRERDGYAPATQVARQGTAPPATQVAWQGTATEVATG